MKFAINLKTVTIKCNFDADWCDFSTSANGDDPAKAGFKWQRKTGQQIKENSMEGPELGLNNRLKDRITTIIIICVSLIYPQINFFD